MRLAARSCARFAPATRSQPWLRGFGTQSLHARPRPIALKARMVPIALAGQGQIRVFRRANYIEKIGDDEKAEQILETLEVKDDERDDRPQRRVRDGKCEKTAPPQKQRQKSSEHMAQGM